MFRSLACFSLLATVSAANSQSSSPTSPTDIPTQPAAPIVRSYQPGNAPQHWPLREPDHAAPQISESQPVMGVWLRSESASALTTVSATAERAEFRLDRGRLNVSVHHPADHAEILVDLPGGQVSLLKDGLYTFNADTNTVRVLRGEAAAFPGPLGNDSSNKPIKIKEDHQLGLVLSAAGGKSGELKPVESYPYEIATDLLPSGNAGGYADGDYEEGFPPYPPYPYYAGFLGYPYFYPGFYRIGYPFAYGIGFGYFGGFHGAYGFRGGFRR